MQSEMISQMDEIRDKWLSPYMDRGLKVPKEAWTLIKYDIDKLLEKPFVWGTMPTYVVGIDYNTNLNNGLGGIVICSKEENTVKI